MSKRSIVTIAPGAIDAERRLMSLKDAANVSGISIWTLRDLIATGRLRAVQPTGIRRIYIDRRELERAIESWKS